MKVHASAFGKLLKTAGTQFRDSMQADFTKLSDAEKSNLVEMEKAVSAIRNDLDGKSHHYHVVALSHIPVYSAVQEMNPDAKIPLVATYAQPYDPNTTSNQQVMVLGAYLNYYLEVRIKVGGMDMGPDIVDPNRIVFTFPDKLLEGITSPTYIEFSAAPKKLTGKKFEDHVEQKTWVLVYPLKK